MELTTELTQIDADFLISMEKERVEDKTYEYPKPGTYIEIPLISVDKKENFVLDMSRKRIEIVSVKYQTRYKQKIVLVRFDINSTKHTNPDGKEISQNHVHLYKERHNDKWAIELSDITKSTDIFDLLKDFYKYCKIVKCPNLQEQQEFFYE